MSDRDHRQKAQRCLAIAYNREGLSYGSDPIKECMAATGWNRAAVIRAITEEFDREIRPVFPQDMARHLWRRVEALWDADALEALTDAEGNVRPVAKRRDVLKTPRDIPEVLVGDTPMKARGKLLKWRPKSAASD